MLHRKTNKTLVASSESTPSDEEIRMLRTAFGFFPTCDPRSVYSNILSALQAVSSNNKWAECTHDMLKENILRYQHNVKKLLIKELNEICKVVKEYSGTSLFHLQSRKEVKVYNVVRLFGDIQDIEGNQLPQHQR